ncbi:MAG: ABC transporter permease [Lachnospiraceae bacterium]|nr:ABC transporter permease [Lachnospiraceae bacterium]
MVTGLLKIQFARLKRQKIFYLYFAVMAAIIISNALRCTGSPEDNGMVYYAGGRFPTFCVQSYIDIVGSLFLSFICAVLISGEKASGMLKQPLLNGVSKKQLLMAKTISLLMVALVFFLFVILFSIGIGFLFWGSHVFDHARECLLQIALLTFPQITMVLFLVFLSLHMSNISSMMCASLIILLINNLFSQFFGDYISFVDFMYYLYAFTEYNGMTLKNSIITLGVSVNLVTGMLLIYGIARRINNMVM